MTKERPTREEGRVKKVDDHTGREGREGTEGGEGPGRGRVRHEVESAREKASLMDRMPLRLLVHTV